jgi:hypothetical protein
MTQSLWKNLAELNREIESRQSEWKRGREIRQIIEETIPLLEEVLQKLAVRKATLGLLLSILVLLTEEDSTGAIRWLGTIKCLGLELQEIFGES